jgi:hypothetical protein
MASIDLPSGHIALIDDVDLPLLAGRRWQLDRRVSNLYVRGQIPGVRGRGAVYLHNILMGGPADHRDGNGLNCQRANLRLCSQAENSRNYGPKLGKPFKGVYFHRGRGVYYAQLKINGKTITGGASTPTPEAAARLYDALALEHFGEFAWLNFPPEGWVQNAKKT